MQIIPVSELQNTNKKKRPLIFLQFLNPIFQMRHFVLPNAKSLPPLSFLLELRSMPASRRIIDGRFTPNKNERVIKTTSS